MVLGHQAWLLTEVKKYLPYNVGHKSIKFYFKPPSLSSFLVRYHFRMVWKGGKEAFKYGSLMSIINLIYDKEFANLVHNQLFFSPFFTEPFNVLRGSDCIPSWASH